MHLDLVPLLVKYHNLSTAENYSFRRFDVFFVLFEQLKVSFGKERNFVGNGLVLVQQLGTLPKNYFLLPQEIIIVFMVYF